MENREAIRSSNLLPAATTLVILGSFTKSAQFPLHFWLPNAMAAPTPVSAYLHLATMVKAGVYILVCLSYLLNGTGGWFTGILGGWMAWQRPDMKKIMAYTIISALGILVLVAKIPPEDYFILDCSFALQRGFVHDSSAS